MRLRHYAALGAFSLALLIPGAAHGSIPRPYEKKVMGVAAEHITKETDPKVKLKPGEHLIFEAKIGDHSRRVITNKRDIIIIEGKVDGVLERENEVQAYARSEDGNTIFMLQKDGNLKIYDVKDNQDYEYFDAEIAAAAKGKSFESGICKGWSYLLSTDMKTVIWMKMEGEMLDFFIDNLPHDGKGVDITPGENGLEIYVDGERIGILTPPGQ